MSDLFNRYSQSSSPAQVDPALVVGVHPIELGHGMPQVPNWGIVRFDQRHLSPQVLDIIHVEQWFAAVSTDSQRTKEFRDLAHAVFECFGDDREISKDLSVVLLLKMARLAEEVSSDQQQAETKLSEADKLFLWARSVKYHFDCFSVQLDNRLNVPVNADNILNATFVQKRLRDSNPEIKLLVLPGHVLFAEEQKKSINQLATSVATHQPVNTNPALIDDDAKSYKNSVARSFFLDLALIATSVSAVAGSIWTYTESSQGSMAAIVAGSLSSVAVAFGMIRAALAYSILKALDGPQLGGPKSRVK